jgi:hypothetical protein
MTAISSCTTSQMISARKTIFPYSIRKK